MPAEHYDARWNAKERAAALGRAIDHMALAQEHLDGLVDEHVRAERALLAAASWAAMVKRLNDNADTEELLARSRAGHAEFEAVKARAAHPASTGNPPSADARSAQEEKTRARSGGATNDTRKEGTR